MAEIFEMLRAYTPQEINQLQQILSQRYQEGALQNQTMNTVANMTKNLSPAANLGIALGTLGGRWAAQRFNDLQAMKIRNEQKINDAINEFSDMSKYGPRYYGNGIPKNGAYAGQLSYFFPNQKFFVNGQEVRPYGGLKITGWQRPDATLLDDGTLSAMDNATPSTALLPSNVNSYISNRRG